MPASTVSAKKPRGKPFPPGPDHPRYKRGKAAVPRLSDGRSIYELFRSYTEDAATLLADVLRDPSEEMELRVKAAAIILQRGWGDAPKALQVTPITGRRAAELTNDELLAMVLRQEPALIDLEPMASVAEQRDSPAIEAE
jgi:hypothetical protein